jgi:hypothetical protein
MIILQLPSEIEGLDELAERTGKLANCHIKQAVPGHRRTLRHTLRQAAAR